MLCSDVVWCGMARPDCMYVTHVYMPDMLRSKQTTTAQETAKSMTQWYGMFKP